MLCLWAEDDVFLVSVLHLMTFTHLAHRRFKSLFSSSYWHGPRARATKSLGSALTAGGVAPDVTCEWLNLRIPTAAKGTPPHPLTLLMCTANYVMSDFTLWL